MSEKIVTLNEEVIKIAKEILRKKNDKVYIHIDLDVLDPDEFSMVPVPEKDGLSFAALAKIIKEINTIAECVGFAILEYDGSCAEEENYILKQLIQYGLDI